MWGSAKLRIGVAALVVMASSAACASDSKPGASSGTKDAPKPVVPAGGIDTRSTYATLESSTLYEPVADSKRKFHELTTLTDAVRDQTFGLPDEAATLPAALLDPVPDSLVEAQRGAHSRGAEHDFHAYGAATGPAGWIVFAAHLAAERALNPVRLTRFLAAVATSMQDAVVANRAVKSDPEPRASDAKLGNETTVEVRVSPEAYTATGPADAVAAASAAAHTIVAMFPSTKTRVTVALRHARGSETLTGRWSSHDINAAFDLGRKTSAAVLRRLASDGGNAPPTPYTPKPGDTWVISPPANSPAIEVSAGTWKPWTECVPSQALPPPPLPGSTEFAEAATAVLDVSRQLDDMDRMQAEHWGYGPGSVTPPGYWTEQFATFLEADEILVEDQTAALALLATVEADTAIAVWREKYRYALIRPIDVIRNTVDRSWSPILVTPNFPAYPSGHSAFSAAGAMVIGTLSPRDAGQAAIDAASAGDSRILGGIHYWFDNAQGMRLGEAISRSCLLGFGITPLEKASPIPLAHYADPPQPAASSESSATGSSVTGSSAATTSAP